VVKEEFAKTRQYFRVAYEADSITNPYARESGTTICVFKDTDVDINAVIRQEVKERLVSRRSFYN
jgi:hypothetical protein